MENIYDIIIIGGGSAGITAGIYAKRAGRKVAVLEKFALGGQLNIIGKIENYTGFEEIEGFDLAQKFAQHAKSQQLEIIKEEATDFQLDGPIKTIKTKKQTIQTYAVIFAMGSFSRELGIEGEDKFKGRGVSYCAICDGNFFKGKRVAVVGSGDSAFADARYLAGVCSHVYLLTKDNLKLHNYAENEFETDQNVTIIRGGYSQKIKGESTLEKLVYKQGEEVKELDVDGVFVAIGRKPETQFLQGVINLDERGYIITNEKMETSLAGVYACGDVRHNEIKQISTAVGEGAIAGTQATKYALKTKAMLKQ
ncbi:MAG: FAD-dependent oxidoreductase [Clostridia bacterium]|nr:FAD-dependent oxidoreductase [Clostridia bacterium]